METYIAPLQETTTQNCYNSLMIQRRCVSSFCYFAILFMNVQFKPGEYNKFWWQSHHLQHSC